MNYTIHAYSTALYSTWYFIEELGILFDAGDGVTSNLLGKTGKIRDVFISHADRDHLGGLMQLNQLKGSSNFNIYYPKDAGSFPALQQFLGKFDPQSQGGLWKPLEDQISFGTKTGLSVKAFENKHIDKPGLLKSLSFKVVETKRKIKPELIGAGSTQIIAMQEEFGYDSIVNTFNTNKLVYSADTPIFDYSAFDNSEILIHEATFLSKNDVKSHNTKNKHSSLEEVLEMVAQINVDKLILGHFSSRYKQHQIDARIQELVKYYGIKIPVYRIPIGKYINDVFENTKSRF